MAFAVISLICSANGYSMVVPACANVPMLKAYGLVTTFSPVFLLLRLCESCYQLKCFGGVKETRQVLLIRKLC
jgi:hypothetical protein